MSVRLFTTPFVATALLMSCLACSKKEDVSPAPNTGSFALDGVAISCQAKVTRSAGSIGSNAYDFLDLNLAPPRPAGAVQRLVLHLYKVPGSPANTYLLSRLSVYSGGNASPYNFAGKSFTLMETSEGKFSGSFTGQVKANSSSIPGPYSTITDGIFTEVQF
ncbi:hypothetical protein [Hymenobacter yonginensis]|uniref:Lipoprotein n=1 Tax=Hymenobacter yonginensis TaxID=748197 RepID=A0ABY7PUK6_9BACT|nr:hypothetical protein [Hymenobacter yonginensis]WBO86239.1 hypothetical protein O9Z63_08250 [Hymenobacter yonginensis]